MELTIERGHWIDEGSKLSRIDDFHFFSRLSAGSSNRLNLLDKIETLIIHHSTEDDMLIVQPGSFHGSDKKLRSVCILSRVSHTQKSRTGMGNFEVLVRELFAVD